MIAARWSPGRASTGPQLAARVTLRPPAGAARGILLAALGVSLPGCSGEPPADAPTSHFAGAGEAVQLEVVQERGEPPVVQLRFAEESEPLLACTGALAPSESSAPRRDLVVRAATRALGGLYVPEGGGPATYRYSGIETAGSLEWRDASGSRQEFSGQVEVPSKIVGGYLRPEDAPGYVLLSDNYLPALAKLLADRYGPEPLARCAATATEDPLRWQAFRALAGLGERAVGALLALAASGGASPRARIEAAHVLGEIGGDQAIAGLRAGLGEAKGELHLATACALARLGDREGIAAAARYLGDRDRQTREAAVNALGESPSDLALSALVEALDDRDDLVSHKAWGYLRARTGADLERDADLWRAQLGGARP